MNGISKMISTHGSVRAGIAECMISKERRARRTQRFQQRKTAWRSPPKSLRRAEATMAASLPCRGRTRSAAVSCAGRDSPGMIARLHVAFRR